LGRSCCLRLCGIFNSVHSLATRSRCPDSYAHPSSGNLFSPIVTFRRYSDFEKTRVWSTSAQGKLDRECQGNDIAAAWLLRTRAKICKYWIIGDHQCLGHQSHRCIRSKSNDATNLCSILSAYVKRAFKALCQSQLGCIWGWCFCDPSYPVPLLSPPP
jgi:hypothetical protein